MPQKPKVFVHLLTEVVKPGICVACGSCVSVCPEGAISFIDNAPKLTGKCTACGTCYLSCPRTGLEFNAELKTEEPCGIIMKALSIQTTSDEIKAHAQDGGAASAILSAFLDSGGETAIVAGLDKDGVWAPVPVLAYTKEKVVECAGTKYTAAPMILGLIEAKKQGLKKIALVGTPCEMQALTRRNKALPDGVDVLGVGLFCMETFNHDKLMTYLVEQGVDPLKVKKFEIRRGSFIARVEGGEPFELKVRKLKELVRPCCRVCLDYTSENADVSVGNVGSPDDWSTVLIRTQKGEEAVNAAQKAGLIKVKMLSDVQPGMILLEKLSVNKKRDNGVKSTVI